MIIVCTVLVSRTSKVNSYDARNNRNNKVCVPPGNTDTTMSPNGRVYVKYNDYEFYPLYLVYYHRPDPCQSHYFNDGSNNNKVKKNRSVDALAADQLQKQQQEQKRLNEQLQQQEQFRQQQEQKRLSEQEQLRQHRDEKLRRYRQELQQQLLWEREEQRRLDQQQQRQNRQPSYNQKASNNCLIL